MSESRRRVDSPEHLAEGTFLPQQSTHQGAAQNHGDDSRPLLDILSAAQHPIHDVLEGLQHRANAESSSTLSQGRGFADALDQAPSTSTYESTGTVFRSPLNEEGHRAEPRRSTDSYYETTTNQHQRSSSSRSSSSRTPSSSNVAPAATSTSSSIASSGSSRGRGGLITSLDTGMAAIKGWIQSHSHSNSDRNSHHITTNSQQRQLGEGRTTSLGEEDIFAMTMSGQDPRSPHPRPGTIVEEDDSYYYDNEEISRQRTHSEPNVLMNFSQDRSVRRRRQQQQQSQAPSVSQRRHGGQRQQSPTNHNYNPRGRAYSTPTALRFQGEATIVQSPRQLLSSSAAAALLTTNASASIELTSSSSASPRSVGAAANADDNNNNVVESTAPPPRQSSTSTTIDRDREARLRWLRINRRFQVVITIVGIIFSLMLFSILIAWVVLTSTYVVSFDKYCDVPLKSYYFLVTFQLVLDVFRTDILRCIFRWEQRESMPTRVVLYNIGYLLYASLVLRLGIQSVFIECGDNSCTCQETAPELFKASTAFVSLSIAAWATILGGYVLPLCIVAAILTCNGYNPALDTTGEGQSRQTHPVFPSAYTSNGAEMACVDLLPSISMEDLCENFPKECCICMEDFNNDDSIVKTTCNHVFHKPCFREWLRQARTCPVCRSDIPSMVQTASEGGATGNNATDNAAATPEDQTPDARIPIGPTGRPVRGLLRIFRNRELQREDRDHPTTNIPPAEPDMEEARRRL